MKTSRRFDGCTLIGVGLVLSFAAIGCRGDDARQGPDAGRKDAVALGGPDTKKPPFGGPAQDFTPLAAEVPAGSGSAAASGSASASASAAPASPVTRARNR